ncbi:MAG TPA: AMP-binding protein [Pyrinomonadaceae bacterium]
MEPVTKRQTLLSYLDDYISRGRCNVFVQREGLRLVSWSYEKLALTSRRIARELERRGVEPGERVILCGANSAEWVAAFWGCLLRGAVVVPLDRQSSPEFVASVQEQTDAKLALADREANALKNLTIPIIQLDQLAESTATLSSKPYSLGNINRETLAQIIFTSGTTSTPKGVMLTHGNMLANLIPLEREINKYRRWRRLVHPLRFLVLVPLSHVFGQFMSVFVPQLLGGEVHFDPTLNPAEIVRRTRKSRISVIVLVPRMLRSLKEWIERDAGSIEPLHKLIEGATNQGFLHRWWTFRRIHRQFGWKFWAFLSGGATLDHQTEEFWRRAGYAVLQGYGMTETASLVTVTHPFKLRQGSIGKVLPGYEVKLDESGQIAVRGPAVSAGYWSSANGHNRSNDGWLHTGDVGTIDEQGHVYFKGREKDVIVTTSGVNVYPEDLEEALNQQPEVRASCVVAWTLDQGEEPLAAIILRQPEADVSKVIEKANASLAEHQHIRRWYSWPEPDFPRTPTDKILKREVIARIKQASSDSCDVCASSSFIVSMAGRITGETPTTSSDPNLKLATDLKLDSMGRIELLSALENRYEIDLDEAAFTAATTLGDVERIIRGEAEQRTTPYPFADWPRRFPITWLRALLFYALIWPITRVMSRMSIEGRDKLRELNGPALFAANHVTLGDQAMVLVGLPLRLRHKLAIGMEGERLRDWLHPPTGTPLLLRMRLLAQYVLVRTFFHVFPLPRRSGFRRSFAYAGECIDRGESVLVFPEGVRAPKGQMHMSPFKAGIGVLVKELNIPVVPVKLNGLYELKKRRQYFADAGTVSVVFGDAIRFDPLVDATTIAAELERILEKL